MKNINIKTLILATTLFLTSNAFASTFEYPQLYKDTRIMGMGGANIAVGGQTSSIFYNTAGLSDIPKEYGWEVDLFNFNISLSDKIADFANDMNDANDIKNETKKTVEILKVTENYLGKNLHLSGNIALLTIGKKFDKYAFGFMPIVGINTNTKTH
jgi:hypothetical protein